MRARLAFLALGIAAVVAGCALIAVPLGLIVGGVAVGASALYWPYEEGSK